MPDQEAFVIQSHRSDIEGHPWRVKRLEGIFYSEQAANDRITEILEGADEYWEYRVVLLDPETKKPIEP